MKTRLDEMPVREIASLMIYPITTKTGYQIYTPCGCFPSVELAIEKTVEWLSELVD